jgi:hypothetical protein
VWGAQPAGPTAAYTMTAAGEAPGREVGRLLRAADRRGGEGLTRHGGFPPHREPPGTIRELRGFPRS